MDADNAGGDSRTLITVSISSINLLILGGAGTGGDSRTLITVSISPINLLILGDAGIGGDWRTSITVSRPIDTINSIIYTKVVVKVSLYCKSLYFCGVLFPRGSDFDKFAAFYFRDF